MPSFQVSIALSSGSPGAFLGGTRTVATGNDGVAKFTDLSVDRVGNGYTLTATAVELTQTSGAFSVSPSQTASIVAIPPNPSFSAAVGDAVPPVVNVSITNGGGGTLAGLARGPIIYGAGEPNGWLGTANLSGTSAPATLTLQPGTTSLRAGGYHATVPISASGNVANSPLNVGVTYTVSQQPPAADLGNGETRAGGINTAGQTATYSFTANQGDAIVVSIGEVAPTADFSPWIRVYSPTGALLNLCVL